MVVVAAQRSTAAVLIQPTGAAAQDTFVYQAMPTWNFDANGFERFIVLGKSSAGHDLNGLLKFDLTDASMSAGEKALLNLHVGRTESTGFPGVSPSPSGVAVLDVAPASSTWSASTVTYGSGVSGGSVIASQSIDGTGQWISLDVTPLVSAWLDGTAVNNGLFLNQRAPVNSGGWVGLVFDSGATAYAPSLSIVSSTPEPASAALVAAGVLVLGRRRSR